MIRHGHSDVDVRLRQIVALREALGGADPRARGQIWRVARELRLELGDSVAKVPAARALGISVRGLDHWVARGEIPAFRRPGAGRSRVESDAVLDVLEEVSVVRRAGVTSGVIAAAIARMRVHGRLRPKLKPNERPTELRRVYEATTPVARLTIAAELSNVQTRLAAMGARS